MEVGRIVVMVVVVVGIFIFMVFVFFLVEFLIFFLFRRMMGMYCVGYLGYYVVIG